MPEIKAGFKVDGGLVTECTNFCFDGNGVARTFSLNANAVLVQFVKGIDADGNFFYQRVISISLIDPDMKHVLMEEAHRILRSL